MPSWQFHHVILTQFLETFLHHPLKSFDFSIWHAPGIRKDKASDQCNTA